VVRDEEEFKKFYNLVINTPYCREEIYWCKELYKEPKDDVEKVWMFLFL